MIGVGVMRRAVMFVVGRIGMVVLGGGGFASCTRAAGRRAVETLGGAENDSRKPGRESRSCGEARGEA